MKQKTVYFDSANIAESYSGIVLPLTCSFASMVYERVYKDLLHMSGVSKKTIEKYSDVFEHLLGFFYGRMYYNMNNWYKMAEFVPGYRRNKQNFELMITSNITAEVETSIRPPVLLKIFYPLIVAAKVAVFGITSRYFRYNTQIQLRWLRAQDFERLSYEDCMHLFDTLNHRLLRRWYVTLENDFFVMTYLGLLKKMVKEEDLQTMLIFRSKATEQVTALASLSEAMYEEQALWRAVESDDVVIFRRELAKNPPLEKRLANYLDTFGGRFAYELKLESIGVDEDPKKLFSTLRAYRTYVKRTYQMPNVSHERLGKRILLRVILTKFKKYAARREEFRLLRSNTFAMARRLFRRMGQILTNEGMIVNVDDIFHLTLDEILTKGAKGNRNLRDKVELRKKEYRSFEKLVPPVHFATTGNELPRVQQVGALATGSIRGRPGSPGVVRGRVKLCHTFSMPSKIDFEILVASHTDPGWTPLIALSKGLIIEHGGVLSHASIVARELGIPAVIGAEAALSMLRDGAVVEIDGSRGTITM